MLLKIAGTLPHPQTLLYHLFFWCTISFIVLHTEHLSYFSEENKPGALRTVTMGAWLGGHTPPLSTQGSADEECCSGADTLWKTRGGSFMMRGSSWSLLEAGRFIPASLWDQMCIELLFCYRNTTSPLVLISMVSVTCG